MGSGKFVDMTWTTTLDESDLYDIVESYAEGEGIVELARRFRVRTAVINVVLKENGVPPRKTLTANTPIERRLHDALKAAGIGFVTQKRVAGRYVADIVINQAPVVIEADGMRYHIGDRERSVMAFTSRLGTGSSGSAAVRSIPMRSPVSSRSLRPVAWFPTGNPSTTYARPSAGPTIRAMCGTS